MSMPPSFPFTKLTTELALEIFRTAATPDFALTTRRSPYADALVLCRVSRALRHEVLPVLLHTVILRTSRALHAFMRALRMQRFVFAARAPHLHVEYAALVRRLYVAEAWEAPPAAPEAAPPMHTGSSSGGGDFGRQSFSIPPPPAQVDVESLLEEPTLDYELLGPVVLGVSDLALSWGAIHVLYHSLSEATLHAWSGVNRTRALTLAGSFTRWRPLTSTAEGCAFLGGLERLALRGSVRIEADEGLGPRFTKMMVQHELVGGLGSVPWDALPLLRRLSVASVDGSTYDQPRYRCGDDGVADAGSAEAYEWCFEETAGGVEQMGSKKWARHESGFSARVRMELGSDYSSNLVPVVDWPTLWACGES
ncbi:hypothetical protein CONPUDRAFT_144525 [Coniophora puteana RWD-64-598 SS2]|uniref:Uncharacterized protein n=1 Tax=Coniophora puteana (strain RWD-64-598) TaxID=741705 RepID=A0A5M3MN30_CONPW|nr:uncharacterized protein CONPUDRAFT_144525 [Coniophora puteana RWD-64-598 SS2]EIW80436.1 hypothetical protein CONPUDRAFT_144525 [Coniophora puteana RWD-64-598 SS2]